MQLSKRNASLMVIAIATVLLISGVTFAQYYNQANAGERLQIKGTIDVYIDGKLTLHQPDLIMNTAYDWVMCKIFNETTACTLIGGYIGGGSGATNVCKYRQDNGTLTQWFPGRTGANFAAKYLCSLTSIALSTSTSAPVQGTYGCPSMLNANGLVPTKATLVHFGSTNTIVLTSNFVNSGTTQSIGVVCLLPYNDQAGATVLSGPSPAVVDWAPLQDQLTTAQSVANGQSITVQWTISF